MKTSLRFGFVLLLGFLVGPLCGADFSQTIPMFTITDPVYSAYYASGTWQVSYVDTLANGTVRYRASISPYTIYSKALHVPTVIGGGRVIVSTDNTYRYDGDVFGLTANTVVTVVPCNGATAISGLSWTFKTTAPSKSVVQKMVNDSPYPVTVEVYDGTKASGRLIKAITLQPGETWAGELTSASGNDLNVYSTYKGGYWDSGTGAWVSDPGFDHPAPSAETISYSSMALQTGGTNTGQVTTSLSMAGQAGGPGGTIVSSAGYSSPSMSSGTAAVTRTDIADSTNAITGAMGKNTGLLLDGIRGIGGSTTTTGGTTVDMTATNALISDGNQIATDIKGVLVANKTRDDAIKAEQDALKTNNPSLSDMSTAGTSAQADASATLAGTAVSSTALASGGDYAAIMTVAFPASFGGQTIHLNPMENTTLATIAHAFRAALAWLVLIKLAQWYFWMMGEWVRGFSTVPQAKGNPVAAGTGAQATALVAAGAMSTIIVVGLTALAGWTFGDFSLSYLKSVGSSNPLAGWPAASLGFLLEFFPLATICSALVARMSFSLYASSLFAGVAAAVRFVVP